MNIKYKFLSTNPQENCVEVRYYTDLITEEMLVSNRHEDGSIQRCRSDLNIMLPYPAPLGADLEKYILQFANVQWFEHMERALSGVTDPALAVIQTVAGVENVPGETAPVGDAVPITGNTLADAKAAKKRELAAWRYRTEVGGVSVNGVRVLTDRESQAQLTGALVSLQSGLLQSINWKSAHGTFVTLTPAEVQGIAAAVAQHVQGSFDAEKDYTTAIDACATVEEVNAIVFP